MNFSDLTNKLTPYYDKLTPYYDSAITNLRSTVTTIHDNAVSLANTTSPYRDHIKSTINGYIPEGLVDQITTVVTSTEVTGFFGGFLASAGMGDSGFGRLAGLSSIAYTYFKTTTNEEATKAIETIALGMFVGLSFALVKCCCCSARKVKHVPTLDLDVGVNTSSGSHRDSSSTVDANTVTLAAGSTKRRKKKNIQHTE